MYAGHGIEVNGQNDLIPVDAKLATDRDIQFEAVPLDQVMAAWKVPGNSSWSCSMRAVTIIHTADAKDGRAGCGSGFNGGRQCRFALDRPRPQ